VKPLSRAAIVAVGSEMLTPSRLDTNSLFLTEHLDRVGIDVRVKSVVGDDRADLARALRGALDAADLVICSGGLGPTDDDLTREVVAGVLGLTLTEDPAIVEHLRARFATRGLPIPMPEINRRQAQVPDGATVLDNPNGSAPGLWIEHGDQVVLLLPGPPRELKPMFEPLAAGPLRQRSDGRALVKGVLKVAGRVESDVDQALQGHYRAWERAEPPVAATILATLGQIELHLSARAATVANAEAAVARAAAEAEAVIGGDVFSTDGRSLEAVVGGLLRARGLRIAVAESCTGGLLSSRLTDVPGSSGYLDQSVVVYANAAKTRLVGVPPDLLEAHGAVSEPVARAMAEGMRERAGADVAVGVTGIAGPSGGSPEKPVGLVYVAIADAAGTDVRRFRFFGERDRVKFQATQGALDLVRRRLLAGSSA
jgi:nicotinamide-nucleotide amidase